MKHRYAVVDLETTGGIPQRDRITEIGIVVLEGGKVIDTFQSLINPERTIPSNITRITGITNEMVQDSPKFFEVAKHIIEITEGCVFVAHNVRFDYGFLTHEFKSLGYTYTRRNLCTVRLSRKAFPGLTSYSLGNLIKYFGIGVNHRHRAYDDAFATSIILSKVFELTESQKVIDDLMNDSLKLTKLPEKLSPETILELPIECGVYYFLDESKNVVYVGKSKNIQKRVKQHFSKHSKKTERLFQSVSSIEFEITGSELASLIIESKEIKRIQPAINKIQKTSEYAYGVIQSVDKSGYYKFEVKKGVNIEGALSYYGSKKSALNHIQQIGEQFQLCHKINGIDGSTQSCFNYGIQKCLGACIGDEMVFSYNERFEECLPAINRLFDEDFFIVDKGREDNESVIILIENGHYRGMGYVEETMIGNHPDSLVDFIKADKFNPEADLIIRNYIWANPHLNIIYF